MFIPGSLRSAFIVATVSILTAGGVLATENKRDESKPQSVAGQAKESSVTIAGDSAVSQAQSRGNDHRAKRADVGDGITMEFVRIPPGSFYMRPAHHVQFIKPFYMGKYEVTQAQWKAVMGTTVSQQHKKATPFWHLKGVGPEYPIYYISWEEAAEFCKRLGTNFRLPAETDWEYACRAGSKTRFHYGDDPNYSQLDSHAWYYDNSKGSTHPVGQKKPNQWGLYDMYGNVAEWCSEDTCSGGSWLENAKNCDSSSRYSSYYPLDLIVFLVVFTGNIDSNKKALEIALPKETSDPNIAQEKKPEIKPVTPMAIKGVVRDDTGIPIDGFYMQISPLPPDWILRQYHEGTFEAYRYNNRSKTKTGKYHFYVRHLKRNLVAFIEFDEDVNNLDIRLQPGATLTGTVVDAYGKVIQGTEISLHSQYMRTLPFQAIVESDTEGKFEIKGLPLGHKYRLTIRAKGYRVNTIEFKTTEMPKSHIEIDPIIMARGQFSVSGIVLDKKRKPVANATVQCFIKEPVNIHTQTDANGRFTAYGIFEGPVHIYAHKREESTGLLWYGQKDSRAGATNVKVVLRYKTTYGPPERTP
jgi:formylglycine-generating enzyme required for sulfatase activity